MADYVGVLWRWRLSIDKTERSFLRSHLASCGWPTVKEPKRPSISESSPPHAPGGGTGPHKGVKITAIYFDSPGPDNGGDTSLNHEWVKIANTSKTTATLSGWVLVDASHNRYTVPCVQAEGRPKGAVHTGHGHDGVHNLYQDSGSYIWNNTGDTATLKAGNGNASTGAHTRRRATRKLAARSQALLSGPHQGHGNDATVRRSRAARGGVDRDVAVHRTASSRQSAASRHRIMRNASLAGR